MLYLLEQVWTQIIRQNMPSEQSFMKNVRFITTDNLMGEESDIILLKWVALGQLLRAPRANVAFSRMKHGLIVFGGAEANTCVHKGGLVRYDSSI